MSTSVMTKNYFVNHLTRTTAQKQDGIEIRLPHTHTQSPSWIFWVIPSQSETIRSMETDMEATLRAHGQ